MDIRKKNSVASFKYYLYKSYLNKQKATMIMSLINFKFLSRFI